MDERPALVLGTFVLCWGGPVVALFLLCALTEPSPPPGVDTVFHHFAPMLWAAYALVWGTLVGLPLWLLTLFVAVAERKRRTRTERLDRVP